MLFLKHEVAVVPKVIRNLSEEIIQLANLILDQQVKQNHQFNKKRKSPRQYKEDDLVFISKQKKMMAPCN